jgi:uncharacterized protein DUF4383
LSFGVWWTLNGIAVFVFGDPSPATLDGHGEVSVFGISIAANGWHGLFHLFTGLVGLAVCLRPAISRGYALIVGATYLTVAAWGLVGGSTVAAILYVDTAGSVVHAVEATIILAAGIAAGELSPHPR